MKTVADQPDIKREMARLAAEHVASGGFPPMPDRLPHVDLSKWRLQQAIIALIKDGTVEADLPHALERIYAALSGKGMTPVQIASVCWNTANKISAAVQPPKHDYAWLCDHITHVLAEVAKKRTDRDSELFRRYYFVERQRTYWDADQRVLIAIETFKDRHRPAHQRLWRRY